MAETMTNADNFWLHMDHPTNLMIITGIMEFNEKIDFDEVCEILDNRLCAFDRFKQRVIMPVSGFGIASWEFDPYFDIRSHCQRVALPDPGGKNELKQMVSDLMTIPMDRTKPLWTCHLIENYNKGCALFFRLHHCIADGMSLVYVMLSTTDKKPGTPLFGDKLNRKRKKWAPPSFIPFKQLMTNVSGVIDKTQIISEKLIDEWSKVLSKPSYIGKLAKKTGDFSYDTAAVLGKLTVMPTDPKTSLKGLLKVRKCVAWAHTIPLDKVKIISKTLKATVNDVLVACLVGALRRHLIIKGDRVTKTELHAAIPVNIRRPGTEFELGNKFSLVFLALPVHIEDPILRVTEVKRRMDHLKGSPDAIVAFMVLSALGISSAKIAKTASNFFANKATAIMTNVPGPQTPLYFAGKKLENFIGWVPRSGQVGLGISIITYEGKVGVGLVTDEGLVSDPDIILNYFEEEFNRYYNLTKTGKVATKTIIINGKDKDALPSFKATIKKPEAASTPDKKSEKCAAKTKAGAPCKTKAMAGSKYCKRHQILAEE